MDEYITNSELKILLKDVLKKLSNKQIEESRIMLEKIIECSDGEKTCIDRDYIGKLKARKRINRIHEINDKLLQMSDIQIENVHHYTIDEYDEPNHEAEALKAIINLSRKE